VSGIRGLHPDDLPALREICLDTAGGGRPTGAEERMLPDVYCEPYVLAHPDWAWVVDLGGGPLGYIIAAPDTRAFADWWRREWAPVFRARHGDDGSHLARLGLGDADLINPAVDEFPAHLHIDLLPSTQGQGFGRVLMHRLLTALDEAGVPGVHLGVADENTGAKAFYAKLGFAPVGGDVNLLARSSAGG
jgi:ribosomal protein S18 acetylase RimI-like enzyme